MKSLGRFKVIATTACGVAIVLFGLVSMASAGANNQNEFHAQFDNVIGLTNHSQVMYHGVKVGEITGIAPLAKDGKVADLTVEIDKQASIDMRVDATLVLRLKTILGELNLDIDPGHAPERFHGPLTLSHTHRDTSLDQIIFQGAALYRDVTAAEQTKVVVDQFKEVMETSGGDITTISHNSRQIVDRLTQRVGQVDTIIENLDRLTQATDGRAQQLGQAIEDVNATVTHLRDLLRRDNAQIKSLLSTINNVVQTADLTQLDKQLAMAPAYMDQVDRGLRTLRSVLQHKQPIFANEIAFPPDVARDFYNQTQVVAQTNPFLRQLLIQILSQYLTGN